MGDAHGGIGCVDVLPTSARRAHRVDPQVIGVDLDIHVFGLGQHRHGGCRGMDTPTAFCRGHALDPVHAALELQPGKNVLPGDMGHDFLHAAKFGHLALDQIKSPAARFGVALVHP